MITLWGRPFVFFDANVSLREFSECFTIGMLQTYYSNLFEPIVLFSMQKYQSDPFFKS